MPTSSDFNFPIQLAIRLLLDSVSYTNALPEWFDPIVINYNAREIAIRRLIAEYLGGAQPQTPFQIVIPKRNGASNTWIIPSINDQIVCQACISVVAGLVQSKTVDTTKVFSCRLNREANRLALLEDQVTAWANFQAQTQRLCTDKNCVLQIDLKDAFDSIVPDKINTFIDQLGIEQAVAQLLKILLRSFNNASVGMPFLNDSLFFLGNAYLSEVDKIVAKRSTNFIRFLDDYKIFASSYASLENSFEVIKGDLRAIGWEINDKKVWLGSAEDYLEAASKLKYGATEKTEYVQSAVQPGVFEPIGILGLVKTCLAKPEDYLHQGFGRLLMGAIRRMRVSGICSDIQQYEGSPRDQFAQLLGSDPATIARLCELMEEYSQSDADTWRLVWLLYLCEDIDVEHMTDNGLQTRLIGLFDRIQNTQTLSEVCRLWARSVPKYWHRDKSLAEIEELHTLNYIDYGRRCYGA